jgi:hypothetical protein
VIVGSAVAATHRLEQRHKGSRARTTLLSAVFASRVALSGKEVYVPMSIRRRWRIARVRGSLNSRSRRAVLLPRIPLSA